MTQVLVTGGSGQVGTALQRLSWPDGWSVAAPGRDRLDLADTESLAAFVARHRPAMVINAAAYTAVDRAEREVAAAWRINALAPAALAAACRDIDAPLIQLSTDYVFDGEKEGAWEVDDAPAPLGVYGASKLAGEIAVRAACPRHVVLRTAWVVGADGGNFVRTMLRLAKERDRLRVVADQHGSPTAAADLADAIRRIAVRLTQPDPPCGVFHFSNSGTTTWHAFAQAIFAGSAIRGGPAPIVDAIATADYPTPARRPRNSLLSHAAIARTFGVAPRPWQAALDDILDEAVGPPKELRA